ncbi:MAG: hypothetical protein LBR16_07015 [Treponema sp.]|jgi:hypothetical protein|nr:hypothetical protein [Treponema sp.]
MKKHAFCIAAALTLFSAAPAFGADDYVFGGMHLGFAEDFFGLGWRGHGQAGGFRGGLGFDMGWSTKNFDLFGQESSEEDLSFYGSIGLSVGAMFVDIGLDLGYSVAYPETDSRWTRDGCQCPIYEKKTWFLPVLFSDKLIEGFVLGLTPRIGAAFKIQSVRIVPSIGMGMHWLWAETTDDGLKALSCQLSSLAVGQAYSNLLDEAKTTAFRTALNMGLELHFEGAFMLGVEVSVPLSQETTWAIKSIDGSTFNDTADSFEKEVSVTVSLGFSRS